MRSLIGRSFDAVALQEQHKKRRNCIGITIVSILLCCVLFYFAYHWFLNRQFTSHSVTSTMKVQDDKMVHYRSFESGILRYGRDGASAISDKGQTVWNGSYDMATPKADTCGSSVVIADIGEKSLYVYKGSEDKGASFRVDYPIVQACVSEQGIVAVLTEDISSNTIYLYDLFTDSDKLLAEIPTNVDDGYPVSLDIAPDGSSIVVSYLCVTTGIAQSRVAFYNFSDVGKNENCFVGAHNYNDRMISEVHFWDNDHVILFAEKGFAVWENMKQPKAVWKKPFSGEIQSAVVNDSYVGLVLKEGETESRLYLYGQDRERKLAINVDSSYDHVEMSDDEVLFYTAGSCTIYRTNGVKKYNEQFKSKISAFFPGKRHNRYFMIQNSKVKVIRLK